MSKIIWLKYDETTNGVKEVAPVNGCVGFLDSGMGGMSIVEYLARKFPEKTFMFLKDSDNFPYGPKSKEELVIIGQNCVNQLLEYNPPMICIACNTMCCALTDPVSPVPILRINEQIAKQVKQTLPAGKKIYIISTQATKNSNFYQDALKDYVVDAHATPEFVLMVEHNEITKEKVAKVILDKPFDSDGIILGCTHFNYLYDICHELLGDKVHIFDGLKNLEEYIINY